MSLQTEREVDRQVYAENQEGAIPSENLGPCPIRCHQSTPLTK